MFSNCVFQETKAIEPAETEVTDNPYLRPVKMPRKSASCFKPNKSSSSALGPNINRIVLGGPINRPSDRPDPEDPSFTSEPTSGVISPDRNESVLGRILDPYPISESNIHEKFNLPAHGQSVSHFGPNDQTFGSEYPSGDMSYLENEDEVISPEARDRIHTFSTDHFGSN